MSHNLLSGLHSFVFDKPWKRSIELDRSAKANRRMDARDRRTQHASTDVGAVLTTLEDQVHVRARQQPVLRFDERASGTDVENGGVVSGPNVSRLDAVLLASGMPACAPPVNVCSHYALIHHSAFHWRLRTSNFSTRVFPV